MSIKDIFRRIANLFKPKQDQNLSGGDYLKQLYSSGATFCWGDEVVFSEYNDLDSEGK